MRMKMTTENACPHCLDGDIGENQVGAEVCLECGFVLDAERVVDARASEEPTTAGSDCNDSLPAGGSFEGFVPKDSSEQTLIRLLETAESHVYELGGDSEDCGTAAESLMKLWTDRFFQGRSFADGIGAVVYVVFRQRGEPRPLQIVAEQCELSVTGVRSSYRALRRETELDPGVVLPNDYLAFLTESLGLSSETSKKADSILLASNQVGGSPVATAGAALYLAANRSNVPVTLAEIGSVTGVAKETIWRKTQSLS
jgi:transcription initiation factor TFIIIB Brf1 subunit/transcription initiation factor TFIIB